MDMRCGGIPVCSQDTGSGFGRIGISYRRGIKILFKLIHEDKLSGTLEGKVEAGSDEKRLQNSENMMNSLNVMI